MTTKGFSAKYASTVLVCLYLAWCAAPAQAAKYSTLMACETHAFNSFWQNANSPKHAKNGALNICTKIGREKFGLSLKQARSCCLQRSYTIDRGCIAYAIGANSSSGQKHHYYWRDKTRIGAVTSVLQECSKNFFNCQVKATTCAGRL